MTGAGLALTSPPEIAALGDEEACKEDDEDRRQTRGERSPVDVDQTESVIRLVEANVGRFVGFTIFNMERRLVRHVDSWGWSGRSGLLGEILLDQHLFSVLINERLSIGDE